MHVGDRPWTLSRALQRCESSDIYRCVMKRSFLHFLVSLKNEVPLNPQCNHQFLPVKSWFWFWGLTIPIVRHILDVHGLWKRAVDDSRPAVAHHVEPVDGPLGGFLKWRYPQSSFILGWDFPWNQPSSYWGTTISGNPHLWPLVGPQPSRFLSPFRWLIVLFHHTLDKSKTMIFHDVRERRTSRTIHN